MRKAPLLTLLLLLSVSALADDGFLNSGGAPRLLSKHPSIRMVRERVVVEIRPQGHHVEATFVFRNEGPATSVRMGFPDRGDGADMTVYYEDRAVKQEKGQKMPPYSGLKNFRSWVDGKAVPTALVGVGDGSSSWHAKTVAFGRQATRTVRVAYDADGGGATSSGKYLREADYIMHTGASWKGPVGYAEVIVRFAPGVLKGPIRPVATRKLKVDSPYSLEDLAKRPAGTVFWSGFAPPTVSGRELRFVRCAFDPKKADDVELYFGYGHQFD